MKNGEDHRRAPDSPLLLTAEETANLLGISVRHLYQLHSSGRLPRPVRLGRSVRWRSGELKAWVAAGTPDRARWQTLQATSTR